MGMVGIGVLALYEMRSELSKFYIRCNNDTSSLAALELSNRRGRTKSIALPVELSPRLCISVTSVELIDLSQ
jgi:hypothetical protein